MVMSIRHLWERTSPDDALALTPLTERLDTDTTYRDIREGFVKIVHEIER
jgi:hypothetical protein